jgi:iron-sulfur cluster assembly accessory protein
MNKIIKVTKAANSQLSKLAKNNNTDKIIFKAKGGGCNGFNYNIKPYYGKIVKGDEIVEFNNYNIIVCKYSLLHLIGTEIDWQSDYMGSRFVFNNPKAVSKCGCGTSFSV